MWWEVGKWLWELKSEEWNEEETHLTEAGPYLPAQNGGGRRRWESTRWLSASSWHLLGEAERTPDTGRGTCVHVDPGKPLEAPLESGMLAHLGKGFPQNCRRKNRRLELPKADTNNNNDDNNNG